MKETNSFKLFVGVWNRTQKQKTPDLHFDIVEWLEDHKKKNIKRLLLMAFRACGKSTIMGLYAAWRIFRDPDLRILVISADEILAGKMVRNVKRIVEQHPFMTGYKPHYADQWGIDRFTVVRSKELRDPTVISRGITGNMTGSRADLIICDDVEVPNTCDTAEKRGDLRERLLETNFILTPEGTVVYVGTPHNYHSIYTDVIAADHEDDSPFLQNYARLCLPILSEDGQSMWPEKYSLDKIEEIRLTTGPNKFASQMMLQPVNIANGRLDSSLLEIYEGEIAYVKELNRLEIQNNRMISAAAWWDPAFGKEGGDHSVLAICYQDGDSHYWLQHLAVLKPEKIEEDDQAVAQCQQVAACLKKYMVPSVSLETNGIGKFLPGILRQELKRQNVPCSVVEVTSRRPKEIRILEAFDVVMAAQRLHVHKDVMKTPFATELSEWRPKKSSGHDDCLDAVAGALSLQPIRIGSHAPKSRQVWTGRGQSVQAETDFRV